VWWVSSAFSSMAKTLLIESNWTKVRITASRAQKKHKNNKKVVCDKSIRDRWGVSNHCNSYKVPMIFRQRNEGLRLICAKEGHLSKK
jgi:FAD/FMN-containing dehydrogenase